MKHRSKIAAVDLFCGVGGLTSGLEEAGIDVRLAVDIDPACEHPISKNTDAIFLHEDVANLDSDILKQALRSGDSISLLAGCAPCQPFSTYSRSTKRHSNLAKVDGQTEDWKLVEQFAKIVCEVSPDLITMENVPPLEKQPVFHQLLSELRGYHTDYRIVECRTIGLPQTRKRLVLIASRLGPISIPQFEFRPTSVRETIGGLPELAAGEQHSIDRLHRASKLSQLNLRRIKASVPGGTWRDWPAELRARCHARQTGETYPSVYGRMAWDAPAPTITTQCFGYGNGRFGHPEQDRAISLREAAMLQGFPHTYSFIPEDEPVNFAKIGRLIGNAVPVSLGRVIGEIFGHHVEAAI